MDTTFLFANIIRTVRSFRGKADARGVRLRRSKIFCARRPKGTLSHLIRRLYRSDRDCLNALGLRFRLGDEVAHFVADFAFRGDGGRHPALFVRAGKKRPARQGYFAISSDLFQQRCAGPSARSHRQQNQLARDGPHLRVPASPASDSLVIAQCQQDFAKLFGYPSVIGFAITDATRGRHEPIGSISCLQDGLTNFAHCITALSAIWAISRLRPVDGTSLRQTCGGMIRGGSNPFKYRSPFAAYGHCPR